MKNKKMIIIPVMILTLTFLAGTLTARQGRGMGVRPKPPLFSAIDTDGDGLISASELDNVVAALKSLDKNGDGEITREELRPANRQGNGGEDRGEGENRRRRRKSPLFSALDADGDHKISAGEMANAENALRALDTNGDGQLTRKELRPKRRNQ